jgi:hypothetical protein
MWIATTTQPTTQAHLSLHTKHRRILAGFQAQKKGRRPPRGGSGELLASAKWLHPSEGVISYRRIKFTFGLDDHAVQELRRELIEIKRVAADVDGERLVRAPEGSKGRRLARPNGSPSLPVQYDRTARRHRSGGFTNPKPAAPS